MRDLLRECLSWCGSIQQAVCATSFLCQGHLASDAAQGFGAGEAVSFREAHDLCFSVGGDHDDLVNSFVYAGFEEEWHFVDDHSMGLALGNPTHESLLLAGDAGMDDAFELPAFRPIAEDDVPEGLSVEGSVWVEDCLPEQCDDLSPGRLAGFDDFMGQFVGIDDDRAALLEHLGDGTLAGGDAACEANENHDVEDSMRTLASQPSLIDFAPGRLV